MRMEKLNTVEPEARNITKARITAYSKEDAVKAADLLAKGWKNHQIKRIHTVTKQPPGNPELISYYVLLWNWEGSVSMYGNQIDDDYIKDIEEGLAKILEEIMKEEK